MSNLAIIAGTGDLPRIIKEQVQTAKVIGFDSDKPVIHTDLLTSLGSVQQILDFLHEHNIKQLVLAGGIKRPDLSSIKIDKEGAKLLAKITASSIFGRSKGDDFLLSKIISYLEGKGFEVVGAHEVLAELKAPKGNISGKPNKEQMKDIELGKEAACDLGKHDIGQAVIVENGIVLAVEAAEGTEELIKRAGTLKKAYGGVLVKCKKPGQESRADLPSIGPETIKQCAAAGITGIAVEAGNSLLLDKAKLLELAAQHNIFVFGIV